ncbi:hypothetical protein CYMTET_36367 [Cymbomonas tetramitiformis]|uniref:Uncharacterized protein n=1 Tax=Cymbomonas tetramitiformis TaxID=36881 RepID=A0AAE0CG24_9CHLO|nr:hypothetical protein CYMTET_36367 [Cymbomonas tetramitiformis]
MFASCAKGTPQDSLTGTSLLRSQGAPIQLVAPVRGLTLAHLAMIGKVDDGEGVPTTSGKPEMGGLMNASTFLHFQLKSTGFLSSQKRILCEPFSRDIRGAARSHKSALRGPCFGNSTVKQQ